MREARRRGFAALVCAASFCGICGAGGSTEGRRDLGERYARAFSDDARGRRVTWDDRACTFTESVPEAGRAEVAATQSTVVPLVQVDIQVQTRTQRAGRVDVTYRCVAPHEFCISRTRRYGSTVIGTDRLMDHTTDLAASIADAPRLTVELDGLRAACAAKDGG